MTEKGQITGQVAQPQFNTPLPFLQSSKDTVSVDSIYVEYLADSLNIIKPFKHFTFELKPILLHDSIQNVNDSTVQQVVYDKPSLLFPHKTKPVEVLPEVRNEQAYDWLTGLLFLCLIILTWVRYDGERRVVQLFRAVFARHNMNQLLRDGDILHELLTPLLMFVNLVTLSTLLMMLASWYNFDIPDAEEPWLIFSITAGALLVLWMIKLFAIMFSGNIFRTRMQTSEYLVTNLIFNIASGLVAFPFVFAGFYAGNTVIMMIAAAIIVLGIVWRFVRSIFVAISAQTFPVIYLFLYLCTLEILPFLVLYKLLVN